MAAGSVIFELLMKTASFITDTKRAEKRLKELKKEAAATGKALGVAIAAGAAVATYALKEAINAIDQVGDAAVKIGTTTEAFSELAYAASQEGIAMGDLETALGNLSKAAADGNDAFTAMGIEVKDSMGVLKSADVLFRDVAEKFAGYADGTEKSALSMELFGKTGTKLITTLNMGSAGLNEMAAEARAFGVVVSKEAATAAGEFNDNIFKLGVAAKGFATDAASALLPTLLAITDEMVRGSKEGEGYGKVFGEAIASALKAVIILASDVSMEFKGLGRNIGGTAAQLVAIGKLDFEGSRFIGAEMKKDAAAARAELDAFQARIMGIGKAAEEAAKQVDGAFSGPPAPSLLALQEAAKAEKDRLAAVKKYREEMAKERKALEEEGRRMAESVQTPSEKLTSTQGNVNRLAGAGVIDPETQRRALSEAHAVYDQYVQTQRQMLTDGLLTEEQEIQASYDRRRQMILALSEATDAEKADSVAALTEQRDQELNRMQYQRYADLLSEEERLTREYLDRKRQLEDDDALGAEQRYAYLTSLSETYHKRMQELDEEDQAKRDELQRKQIELVSNGFTGVAEITKAFAGEQSKEYQAMFAASKAFALADTTIKQSQAIAAAWAENNYWVAIGITAGLVGQFAGLISSINSANFGGARADGGPVNSGRSYLVGERGPEMFTPNEGGRIIPNDAINQSAPQTNLRIVNAYDTEHVADFMGSDAGSRIIKNWVNKNGAVIRAMNAG